MGPPKFLAYLVILCFERRCPKQNAVPVWHLFATDLFGIYSSYISGVRRKFSWGGFIQWHMVVICVWCALFV